MTTDLDWNVPDLVVLFLEWRLDDDTFVQYDITANEYFGQVSSEDYFLLKNGVVVNFDIVRALDETLFANEVFGFCFEVVFF
jgi:hypothetical protein